MVPHRAGVLPARIAWFASPMNVQEFYQHALA